MGRFRRFLFTLLWIFIASQTRRSDGDFSHIFRPGTFFLSFIESIRSIFDYYELKKNIFHFYFSPSLYFFISFVSFPYLFRISSLSLSLFHLFSSSLHSYSILFLCFRSPFISISKIILYELTTQQALPIEKGNSFELFFSFFPKFSSKSTARPTGKRKATLSTNRYPDGRGFVDPLADGIARNLAMQMVHARWI